MDERRPMAFLSYAHFADNFDDGYLSQFCLRLSGEVCLQKGDDFPIFQDRKDISWGDCWKERINGSLDTTTFLIPVITPGFFKSEYCREELTRFLERERKLGRDDLILPVYYVDTPALNDKKLQANDELAQIIASRQYADWRKLRFDDILSRDARKEISNLAAQICKALSRLDAVKNTENDSNPSAKSPIKSHGGGHDAAPLKAIVVDQMHRGDYATINDAISAAAPGSRISVRPGVYDEGLVIDKALEIEGDGKPGEVVIRAEGKNAILFRTARGIVSNLVLKQIGGGDFYCVAIPQGVLELNRCDITSDSSSCVAIYGKAYPKLRGNKIHDGKDAGIFVYGNGLGLIEDNDIFGNALSGISIKEAGSPTVRGNRINKNGLSAVIVSEKGAGIIENNDLRDNENCAWLISDDSKNLVKRSGNQE